jgi:digeranylgeranylglycerophospholipid reductase
MMEGNHVYDLIVIGAGPAGLSAARTAARLGLDVLLLESLSQAGDLGHPCGAAIAPHRGFVSGRRQGEDLVFPELDLTIPPSLIVGWPATQLYISPGGHEMRIVFPSRHDFPIAAVEKPGLLRLLADQARQAGAELRFGTHVAGLLKEGQRIVGVRTRQGETKARVVLSAEGISRRFSQEAGLYEGTPPPRSHATVVWQELETPAIRSEHVGQIATFGQRYTSAPRAMGTLDMPAPGRAGVYFSFFHEGPRLHAAHPPWTYLEAYKREDPRVRDLLAGSAVVQRKGCQMVVRDAPSRAVRDGFLGLGDAVTPGGQMGIVPAMFSGRRAAEVAAQAIRAGDTSAQGLAAYDRLLHGPFLRGMETEGKIILGLASMTDEEMDRVCQTCARLDLAPFFFGEPWPMLRASVQWLVRALPLILRDGRLIRRMMAGGSPG